MTEDEKITKAFMRYATGKAKDDKYLRKKLNLDNKCLAERTLPESIQCEIIKAIHQKRGNKE